MPRGAAGCRWCFAGAACPLRELQERPSPARSAGPASAAHSDAVLTIELRHFEAQYGSGLQWRIELNADLISAVDRKVIATRLFTGNAAVPQNDMAAIVAGADQAWRGVATQIVNWAADTLAPRPRR